MLQIVNITDARNNLAKLIEKIKDTKKPVVIVQDSTPSVVIYPYDEVVKREEEKDQLFQQRFDEVFKKGEEAFGKYLQKNKLQAPRTEEEAYDIIKND
jgi:prevent-host-death family protein